jgi:hypothetical protein
MKDIVLKIEESPDGVEITSPFFKIKAGTIRQGLVAVGNSFKRVTNEQIKRELF